METAHFDVYFFAEEAELAAYAAQMAERQFVDLEKKFAHTVQRRVPLVSIPLTSTLNRRISSPISCPRG